MIAVVMLAVAVGGLAFLVAAEAHRAWRLALLVPLWAAALGWFQSRERT